MKHKTTKLAYPKFNTVYKYQLSKTNRINHISDTTTTTMGTVSHIIAAR